MDRRFKVQIQDKLIFLVADEFAALRISMDKKEFNETMIAWKELFWWDGSERSLLMALQRAETSVLMEQLG